MLEFLKFLGIITLIVGGPVLFKWHYQNTNFLRCLISTFVMTDYYVVLILIANNVGEINASLYEILEFISFIFAFIFGFSLDEYLRYKYEDEIKGFYFDHPFIAKILLSNRFLISIIICTVWAIIAR